MSTAKVSTDEETLVVVMGVSGCGKSTLGKALADTIRDAQFQDGDDLHPKSNIEKMSQGQPLTDQDRLPWLSLIRSTTERLVASGSSRVIVVACSALRRTYRDILRTSSSEQLDILPPAPENHPHPASQVKHDTSHHTIHYPESNSTPRAVMKTFFIHLEGSREALLQRMSVRKGHFMKETMLDSQLKTLERPDPAKEENVIIVDSTKSTAEQVDEAIKGLRHSGLDLKES